MAVTTTSRLGLTRWSAGSDTFQRSQMDTTHEQLEAKAAGYLQDVTANRPAASSTYTGFIFQATDSPYTISYCDGTSWYDVNAFGSPTAIAIGDTSSDGTGTTVARANHRHEAPAFGAAGANVATSASAGVATTLARSDHVHKIGTGAINAAGMFAAGVVDTTALGDLAVTTAKIAAAAVTNAKMATNAVDTTNIVDDAVTDAKLDSVGGIDAALIVSKLSSVIDVAAVPNLDGSIINSGTVGATYIPSLDAAKITTGTFGTARIPDLDAAKITTGTFGTARIPSLDASKITTGSFSQSFLATGSVGTAQLIDGDVTNAKLAGSITFGKLDATAYAGTPSTQAIGDTASGGIGTALALIDHKHAMPVFGTSIESIGTASSAGSGANIARDNHVHVVGSGAINSSTMFASGVVSNGALASSAVTDVKVASGISASKLTTGTLPNAQGPQEIKVNFDGTERQSRVYVDNDAATGGNTYDIWIEY